MGVELPATILGFGAAAAVVLVIVLVAIPRAPKPAPPPVARPTVRLRFRVLFTRRQRQAITLDCLMVAVERGAPEAAIPAGMPFTLQVWVPQTPAYAARAELLLNRWADQDQELLLELLKEQGRVTTTITSDQSSLELELAGAAGLSLGV